MGSFVNSSPQLLLNSHLHYYDRTYARSLYKYASQTQNSTTKIQNLEQQRKKELHSRVSKTTSQSNNNGKQLKVLFGMRSSVRSSRLDPHSSPERLRGGNHASNHGRGSSQGQSKPRFEQAQFPRRGSPDSYPLAGDWAKERQHLFLDPRGVAAAGEEKARQAREWPHQSYW